jgi:class 3 adenylate cyclase/tetratricopeptide (TPR) repeat protein
MMLCPRCQSENREGRRFCAECGASLALACPACSFSNEVGEKFCGGCGALLGTPAGTATASRFHSPESYTPKHLAEKILTSKAALEGERKQVTVLFADLKGSMELLADRDPEEARKLLDPVLEHMMEAVHRYEGTVNQVMGDGIMALFGAPVAHEDHAVRACYAALRMQESVKGYAEPVRREQGVTIRIRVGLNSGEVVVRSIGSDLRMDYTAVGQTTHLAARMEQLADPGSILLTSDTLALAEGFVHVTPLGPMAVKGLPAPVEVYELVGVSAMRSRLEAAATRGLSRFVGRDAEMEQLRRALEQTRQGRGQVAAAIGEPGVGKSRLTFELTHSHRVEGWLILEAHSVSYGKATSYLPVIDLLKGYFKIVDRDTLRDIREKVTGKILTLDRALEPGLPALLALLDVAVDDPAWQALDPPLRRQRTLDAVKGLFMREAHVQPLLVVFEDLHWIDSETQALLDSLVESLPAVPLFLLVNYRPEYEHRWGSKTSYTQVRLDPLPAESALDLLRGLLGEHAALAALAPVLIQRTQGNPFFLEESVQTLVETQVLVGERGAYRLAHALPSIQVPATVQAVLAARIDRLPPDEKRLLQTAAVVGTEVPLSLLQAIAACPEEALHHGLAHLQAAEFLYETHLFPDREYTFKHALTHEVAYGSLLQERRRMLHARIVAALEALAGDRLAEQVERLAHHALRGEVWDKAVAYCRQAGTKAAEHSAYREAVTYIEQALQALPHLPEGRETLEQAIDLRLDLRQAFFALTAHRPMFDPLREAEVLAEALGDQRRLGYVSAYLSQYFWAMGDQERALVSGQRALACAETLGDVPLQGIATLYLSQACTTLGEHQQAIAYSRRSVASFEGEQRRERCGLPYLPSVFSRSLLSNYLALAGAFAESIAVGEEGVQIAEATDHPLSRMAAYNGIGFPYVYKGDVHRAIPILERGLALCQAANIPPWPILSSSLGTAYALCGRVTDALPLLEQAVAHGNAVGLLANQPLFIAYLSQGYLLAGRWEEATQSAQRALELARAHRARGHEAHALYVLGDVARHRDPPDIEPAEAHYRQALALAEELGMRPLQAHCHYGLGTLYGQTGQYEQARTELSTAIVMYRAMDMAFWLPQTEAALTQVEGR